MKKFRNKYRIPSARAQWWDYGWNGAYFITICTQNREYFFGDITCKDAIHCVSLSPMGEIANSYWYEIPNHFPFVELGDFVVMPNHVHGIVVINKPVETRLIASLQSQSQSQSQPQPPIKTGGFAGNKNPMIHENISKIIRWYKGRCSFEIRKFHTGFAWQPRFHDHIIRNDAEYQRISDYIKNNPQNWTKDKFHIT